MGRKKRQSCFDVDADRNSAKLFDEWFYSCDIKKQNIMRQSGVLPYSEMSSKQYVFDVKENNKNWNKFENDLLVENEQFISVEHVKYMLKIFLDALVSNNDMVIRRHIELVRWTLDMPGKLSSREIAEMYNLSHSSIQTMASELRKNLNLKSKMSEELGLNNTI